MTGTPGTSLLQLSQNFSEVLISPVFPFQNFSQTSRTTGGPDRGSNFKQWTGGEAPHWKEELRHWGKRLVIGGKTRREDQGAQAEPKGLEEKRVYQIPNIAEALEKNRAMRRGAAAEERTAHVHRRLRGHRRRRGAVGRSGHALAAEGDNAILAVEWERGLNRRGADFDVVTDCPFCYGSLSDGDGGDYRL